ncbi:MAG: spore maturation protein [Clostridia bacterium]|nr:spore maturation protein [Clostridia bacterium]
MLRFLASAMLPLVTCIVLLFALRRKVDLFSCFTKGASDGMSAILRLVPTLTALMVGVEMLSASGLFELFTHTLSPVARAVGLPEELAALVLMRPISGSGSMSVLRSLIEAHGVDSLAATAGAVILTSTETTLYTTGLYFGSVGVSNTRCTLPAALLADCTAVLCGSLLTRLLLFR